MTEEKETGKLELDPEALRAVSGGVMMDENEMVDDVVYRCLRCGERDESCMALLNGLIDEFNASPDGTKLDFECPKGLLKL